MTETMNLNELSISDDGYRATSPWRKITDNGAVSSDGKVTVHFRALEERLLEEINRATAVVGCVAWLTNDRVLDALSRVRGGISIVVQKEDFLRPDWEVGANWKTRLRAMYDALPQLPERHTFRGLVGNLSCASDPDIEPIRCMGNHNREKKPAFPRMHNKFLVFGSVEEGHEETQWGPNGWYEIVPHSVWTGSFNLTRNATLSLENAVVLTDARITAAYLSEWEQLLAVSEPLDWASDWSQPEWRIGT